jgi:transposase
VVYRDNIAPSIYSHVWSTEIILTSKRSQTHNYHCSFRHNLKGAQTLPDVTKLTQKKIRWIIRHCAELRDIGTKEAAGIYNISQRRVQQLLKEYRETGEIPVLKKERRPKTPLTEEQERTILKRMAKWNDSGLNTIGTDGGFQALKNSSHGITTESTALSGLKLVKLHQKLSLEKLRKSPYLDSFSRFQRRKKKEE